MNKLKINPMLIHVKKKKKKKEQTVGANYVVVLSMQNAHPYFEWNCLLVTSKISWEIGWKQSKKILIFSLVWQI